MPLAHLCLPPQIERFEAGGQRASKNTALLPLPHARLIFPSQRGELKDSVQFLSRPWLRNSVCRPAGL